MKKFLSILSLISVLSLGNAAMAAPPPQHGAGGHIHAGSSVHRPSHGEGYGQVPPPPPSYHRHHGGSAIIGGVLARRSCWNNYFYDSRLMYCDDYYTRPYYGGGIYIRF